MQVHANEGGVTIIRGGAYWLILPAGYLGSSFWGMVLVLASTKLLTARIAAGCFIVALLIVLCVAKNDNNGNPLEILKNMLGDPIPFFLKVWLLFSQDNTTLEDESSAHNVNKGNQPGQNTESMADGPMKNMKLNDAQTRRWNSSTTMEPTFRSYIFTIV